MLESLQVHNFALLEDVSVEFTKGFNVFTGETGAGKSILIDALGVVLGGRASTDFVRSGTDGYWIQAVFEVGDNSAVSDFLNEQGLDNEDELFLKRMVNSAGKSKASINGVQVPLAVLKQLGAMLVDIHGQHENQLLLQPEAGRLLTDEFGDVKLATAFDKYAGDYKKYQDLAAKVDELRNANNDRE
ncbi:MAG: AAA family ATPase, partial [Phascolarctobacterium sp.]|nr:AAA family ATPase [Candidatus Phascolarctobacterium equi]